jgi:hypothetical protein
MRPILVSSSPGDRGEQFQPDADGATSASQRSWSRDESVCEVRVRDRLRGLVHRLLALDRKLMQSTQGRLIWLRFAIRLEHPKRTEGGVVVPPQIRQVVVSAANLDTSRKEI